MREYVNIADLSAKLKVPASTILGMAEVANYRFAHDAAGAHIRPCDAAEIERALAPRPRLHGDYRDDWVTHPTVKLFGRPTP